MPSLVVNSGNIGTFAFKITFNLQSRQIVFDASGSTYQGAGASAVRGIAFSLVDQVGLPLLTIDWTAPQLPTPATQAVYTFDASGSDYLFLFQAYTVIGAIQDANGNTFSTVPIVTTICEPNGFMDNGYVPGVFELRADCTNNILLVKEYSLLVYNGLQPVIPPSVSGTLYYPTGTIAAVPFTSTPFQNNVVYTGQYAINNTTITTYYLGNDVYVSVSYVTAAQWNFTCSNKIADLLCCITDLYRTKAANCDNAIGRRAADQIQEIELVFFIGLGQEMNGQDASWAYEIIKKKLNCNCGQNAIGQNQVTPINPSVYSIVITGVGGTTVTGGTVVGNTKTYVAQSNIYQITKGNPSDPAFTIGLNTSVPNTVQYPITFNYLALAQAIYTATASDPETLQQLNNLIQALGIDLSGLNGSCVINLAQATYTASQVTTSGTGVQSIVINGTVYNAPTGLLANNITDFQTWLNSLTLGTFTVSLNSGTVTIVSVNNTNVISTVTFTSPDVTLQFQRTNFTITQILQAIINYICNLSALQVKLGANLSLQYFDYNGNVVTQNYSSTNNTQNDYNQAISTSIQSIIARMQTLTGVTCAAIQAIFNDNVNTSWGANSRAYGTDGNGNCIAWTDFQLANMLIGAVNKYSSVKAAWCAIDCTAPGSCPTISAVNVSGLSQTSIGFYGVTWAVNPVANQTVSLVYRVTGTSTWITASNSINIFPNGNISGTPNPFPITGLTPGTTYDIGVTNNCGGVQFVTQVTTPSSTVFSGSFLLDNVLYLICGDSPVTLYSSAPFASGVQMFLNAGLTSLVTGYSLIAQVSTGQIFNLNNTNGIVGVSTGNACATGSPGTYILGNSTGSICSGGTVTLYTNGAFTGGGILYRDSALTTPVTGEAYVVNGSNNIIYNLNTSTGVIGSSTGLSCTATAQVEIHNDTTDLNITAVTINGVAVSGISFPVTPGNDVIGTTNQIGAQTAVVSLTNPTFNKSVSIFGSNGVLDGCQNTPSSGNYTFPSVVVNTSHQVLILAQDISC